jgi:hypothetical protein
MSRLPELRRRLGEAPAHPILPASTQYEIVALHLELCPPDGSEAWLELTLRLGEERRALRFWSPQDLCIEEGGPRFTAGLVILDLSGFGWDRVGVAVDDIEASRGALRFLARSVESQTESAA